MEFRPPNATEKSTLQEAVRPALVPYTAIEKHGLIGDRRTAALVAADGTLDWLCLPDYNGPIIFGALLDCLKGGYWRLGPAVMVQGEQSYVEDTMLLETGWELEKGSLLLSDAMLWPETKRAPERENSRVLVRCLRCTRGSVRCRFDLEPGYNCRKTPFTCKRSASGYRLTLPQIELHFWASCQLEADSSSVRGEVELQAGEELWAVLEFGSGEADWTIEAARGELERTQEYWRNWLSQLCGEARARAEIRRTAMSVHLLSYAGSGCVVAAPTTSLPRSSDSICCNPLSPISARWKSSCANWAWADVAVEGKSLTSLAAQNKLWLANGAGDLD